MIPINFVIQNAWSVYRFLCFSLYMRAKTFKRKKTFLYFLPRSVGKVVSFPSESFPHGAVRHSMPLGVSHYCHLATKF